MSSIDPVGLTTCKGEEERFRTRIDEAGMDEWSVSELKGELERYAFAISAGKNPSKDLECRRKTIPVLLNEVNKLQEAIEKRRRK